MSAFVWLVGLAAATAFALWHTDVRNDMTSFMPRGATPVQRMLMNELREGPIARLTIVAIGGASREALARQSREVAARLRASGAFLRVANASSE